MLKRSISIHVFFVALGIIYSAQCFAATCTPDPNPPSLQGKIPTKTIKIYNNTDKLIYPLIETNTNNVDEWLQAYFGTCDSSAFRHTINYRIYINELQGIAPHKFVAIDVPLYTKLTDDTAPAEGEDKYINWWNGGRIKIYDSLITYQEDLAKDTKASTHSDGVTCSKANDSDCKSLTIYYGKGALADSTPNQLTEYTFAGAPLKENGNGLRVWAIQDVDWDVSYVDSAYLPIAMGVMGNKYIGYTGTILDAPTFKNKILEFIAPNSIGYNWSHYIIPGTDEIIKLPGTYNYMRGVLNKTVSEAPKESPLNNMFTIWKSCFQQGSPSPNYYDFDELKNNPAISCSGIFQADIWRVQQFFLQNLKQYQNLSLDKKTGCDYNHFIQTLKDQNVPMNKEVLARIYGWVPFNDYCNNASAANSLCKTSSNPNDPNIKNPDPTKCTKEYHEVHKIYRDLEYSYTGKKYPVDKQHNFNPYVQLLHGKEFLGMHGYAFSIDDAVGNMQESGNGLIITVGGDQGLENTNAYDPQAAIIVTMGSPQAGRPTWKKYDACDASLAQCIPSSDLAEGGTNFKLGTMGKFPIKVVIKDSADKTYEFMIKEGPNENNHYTLAPDAITNCKVTDKNGNPVAGWCAPFIDKDRHGTPYAHTNKDENDRSVSYVSTNDTLP
jgi:hypothetical protein